MSLIVARERRFFRVISGEGSGKPETRRDEEDAGGAVSKGRTMNTAKRLSPEVREEGFLTFARALVERRAGDRARAHTLDCRSLDILLTEEDDPPQPLRSPDEERLRE
jgi:hypothetical protein